MLASVLTSHVCRIPLRGLSISLSIPLFIQCHCAQTPPLLWNISQQVCYKPQNLPIHSSLCLFAPFVFASTFISLFTLLLSFEFSLCLSLSCSLSTHFTSPSRLCQVLRSLLDLQRFVCIRCLPRGFYHLFCSLKPSTSLCFVSFAQKIAFSQDHSNCLKLGEF